MFLRLEYPLEGWLYTAKTGIPTWGLLTNMYHKNRTILV